MSRARRLLVAPGIVVIAWAAGACGGGTETAAPPSGTPRDEVTSSTAADPSASATPSATASTAPAPVELTVANILDRTATAQSAVGSYDFTMTQSTGGAETTSSGSVQLATSSVSMTATLPGGTMEYRVVDGRAYINMGEASENLFLLVDPDDPDDPFGASLGDMLTELDPVKSLTSQQAALASVTKKGDPEVLDGTSAQPYELVFDTSRYTGVTREQLDAAAAQGIVLPPTVTTVVWIGPDGLVRRSTVELLGTRTDATFFHWGAGAPVEAPPADRVTTFAELFG